MAISEDMGFPRLTPPDDRMPSGRRLLRRPEELSDDQFDLLAAAWAENALSDEEIAEMESVFSARPDRMQRAGSFRRIRLEPLGESWKGMNKSLKPLPVVVTIRRTIIPTLLAAAALILFFIYGPAGAKIKTINNPVNPGVNSMTVAEIPASSPIISKDIMEASGSKNISEGLSTDGLKDRTGKAMTLASVVKMTDSPDIKFNHDDQSTVLLAEAVPEHEPPLFTRHGFASPSSVAPAKDRSLATLNIIPVTPAAELRDDKNWMLRSISFLASAVTGKEKDIDGYVLASGCIKGINSILGWDMELKEISTVSGDPVALSFSSSLLSFTKPLNKTNP